MALRTVAGTSYHLIAFDTDGQERRQPDGSLYSQTLIHTVASGAVTDMFVLSHGWKGDIPAAVRQYDTWIARMAAQTADIAAFRARCPNFQPLVVGLHWPSLPWGDERMLGTPSAGGLLGDGDAVADEFADENRLDIDQLVDLYAARTADTPAARTALQTILAAESRGGDRDRTGGFLTPDVESAYQVLFVESALGTGTVTSAPGEDQECFNPQNIIAEAVADGLEPASSLLTSITTPTSPLPTPSAGLLGVKQRNHGLDLLRAPLRQLSFWSMKRRGRLFGESGAHQFLIAIQAASPTVRLHLMGHSFGCLVVTGAVAGPTSNPTGAVGLPRSVQTLYLVQGAMSLWSFADRIPHAPGAVGYFQPVLAQALIEGPIVTTRSRHDTAVGLFYPRGAQVAGQFLLGEDYPAFGGLGTFGARGIPQAQDVSLRPTWEDYAFAPGSVYNLEASTIIAHGSGASGAHNDLDHDELAHAFWQAALTCVQRPRPADPATNAEHR